MAQKMNIVDKLHQEFVVSKLKNGHLDDGPLVVELDTTEVCNLACPGCISEDLVSNKTSFSRERLLEIGREMHQIGVKAVVLIGGGEPLAHPAVGELIEYLGQHDVRVGITTNGCFIRRYLDVIAKYSSWTRVSMDAATPETFYKLRPGKDGTNKFDEIIDGMRRLATVKTGNMGFSFLIRTRADGFGIESNIDEIYDAAVLAREIGCDYFEVKPSYSYAGGQAHALVRHGKDDMDQAREQVRRLRDLDTDGFKVITAINLEDSLNCVETPQKKQYHSCPAAQLRTLISPSGVYVCPYWRGKKAYAVGNAVTHSLQEIWKSEARREVMERLDPAICCPFHCLRHDTNREVLHMLDETCEEIEILPEYDRFI